MLWYFLRNTLYYCFNIYFKRFAFKGREHIRQKGPMFIAMNHPNAFMDPIAFATFLFYPRTYYMARGDAFKKGVATTALKSMGIVPIFRLRDAGYEGVKKNLESFKLAYGLLDRGKKIMVFAEGLSVKERRLRPIQKGTAKMSFGYLEQGGDKNLKILPVGINYSVNEKFRPYVYFQIGEPIAVADYFEEYKSQPAQTILKLTRHIEERMGQLVPSLRHKENDELIEQLQPILKRDYMAAHKLDYHNPAHQQKYWEFIIDRLNRLTDAEPARAESLRKESSAYSKKLHQLKLRDHLIAKGIKGKSMFSFVNIALLVLGFPFYLVGKILNFLPYYLGARIASKKVKNIEFKASVAFGSGSLLMNLLFVVELIIAWLLTHDWRWLLAYTAVKAVCGWLALQYSPFRRKMLGAFRLAALKKANPAQWQELVNHRLKILDLIGDFH